MYAQFSFHNLLYLFKRSFTKLNKPVSAQRLENLSSIVHQVMSAQERKFHTEQHILDISNSDMGGVETLSILCHDLVYLQIDKGIQSPLKAILSAFSYDNTYSVILPNLTQFNTNQNVKSLYDIFGFSPGQKLTHYTGVNEFLSAFCAIHLLSDVLNHWELMQIAICIEATIPFRVKDDKGKTPTDLIATRLFSINWKDNIIQEDICKAIQAGVEVSNQLVSAFASKDPDVFLAGIWRLIIESNPVLRSVHYTVDQYRSALGKMEGFFNFLKPSIIFKRYQGKPSDEAYRVLLDRAEINLKIGIKYLQVQLIAAALLQSICDLTDGNAPIVLFIGAVSSEDNQYYQTALENQLLSNKVPIVRDENRNFEVMSLLKLGKESSSDLKNSCIGSYLYERLSHDEIEKLIFASKALSTKQISAFDYLLYFPSPLIKSLLLSISKVAETREKGINDIINRIK